MYKISLRVWLDSSHKDYEFVEAYTDSLDKVSSFVKGYDFKSFSVEPLKFID